MPSWAKRACPLISLLSLDSRFVIWGNLGDVQTVQRTVVKAELLEQGQLVFDGIPYEFEVGARVIVD